MPTEETQNIQLPDFPNSAYLAQNNKRSQYLPKIATIKSKIPLRHRQRWVKPARLRIQGVVSNLLDLVATGVTRSCYA